VLARHRSAVIGEALVVLGLVACHAARFPGADAHVVAGVPFYPQEREQCGPAVLASLLGFFGYPVAPETLAREIYDADARGTSTVAMVSYGSRHDLPLAALRGDLGRVRAEIDAGRPVIALLQEGWLSPHYHFVLLTGYEPDSGTLYGYSGRNADASWKAGDFERRWAAADNWILVWAGNDDGTGTPPHRSAGEKHQGDSDEGE